MTPAAVDAAKAAIAIAAALLLLWGAWLRRTGRPEVLARARDVALAALGVASLLAYWNFLGFHQGGILHVHELFNYTIGSKYFRELGYERLYECVAVADVEAGLRARVGRRLITDLETYDLRRTSEILADPDRCKRHFSPARWAAFKGDVGWFRGRFAPERWEALQRDHGFNPTPLWAVMGARVADAIPVSPGGALALASLDPLLDLAAWSAVAWAFGWRAACVALVYWGTNRPAGFEWTGGAFLRHDWLAAMLIGLALLRRGRSLSAGLLFAVAALLRAFPAVLFLGPALAALVEAIRARRLALPPETRRLALGALVGAGLLLPASSLALGADAWRRFAQNLAHHAAVPATNTMGLRTALSFSREGRLAVVLDAHADPARVWKERRIAAFTARRAVFLAVAAAWLGLLAFSAAGQPLWVAALLGTGTIPFVLDGACYYSAFLAAWGLLWLRREAVGAALCALAALGSAIAALLPEPDDAFAATSVAVLAFVALATWLVATPRARAAP